MGSNKVLATLTHLRDPTGPSYYPALDNLLSEVCFHGADKQSQVVILKPDPELDDPEDNVVEPAVFSVVGQVQAKGSYLQPNASYIRESKMNEKDDWRTAAKVKVVLQPTTDTPYADAMGSDWQKITDFVKKVHPMAFDGDVPETLTSPLRTDGGLLFQHTLLVPRDGNDNDDDLDPQFTIEGWPVYGEYRTELDQFIPTHKIEPLPALSVTGAAIGPKQYASQLLRAIVRMDFTLHNWNIKSSNKAALVAKIDCITVLVPPVTAPSSPSKKRFRDLASRKAPQDMPESPSKKGKITK